jgi:hypothetical protein
MQRQLRKDLEMEQVYLTKYGIQINPIEEIVALAGEFIEVTSEKTPVNSELLFFYEPLGCFLVDQMFEDREKPTTIYPDEKAFIIIAPDSADYKLLKKIGFLNYDTENHFKLIYSPHGIIPIQKYAYRIEEDLSYRDIFLSSTFINWLSGLENIEEIELIGKYQDIIPTAIALKGILKLSNKKIKVTANPLYCRESPYRADPLESLFNSYTK